MSRFRFRAWNKNTKKMVCPHKLTPLALNQGCKDLAGVFLPFDESYTIMQSTGLKDKNGVEIFEGDVVRDDSGKAWSVKWTSSVCCFDFLDSDSNTWAVSRNAVEHMEVLGNVYNNPELLEGV